MSDVGSRAVARRIRSGCLLYQVVSALEVQEIQYKFWW